MTAGKEKKGRRDEREIKATGDEGSRRNSNEENSAITDARKINPDEVFDSSKYAAMSDMNEGADLKSENVDTLADPQAAERMEQEHGDSSRQASVETNRVYSKDTAETSPKITPMMVEERARTLRTLNEEINRQQPSGAINTLSQEMKDKFLLHLNLMLSIENAAVERLHARIQQSLLAQIKEQLAHHLDETREQKSRLISLIQNLGGQATDKRAQLAGYSPPEALANALGASATQEEQELKAIEIDALIEHAEAIGYNTLIQMASRMNIGEALPSLRQSLEEEENMVARTRANLPFNFSELWSAMEQKGGPSLQRSGASETQ